MARRLPGRRTLIAVALSALALAWPTTVSADPYGDISTAYSDGAGVDVVEVTFENKLVASVVLALRCDAFDHDWAGEPLEPSFDGHLYGWVELMQAQGRRIAHASGTIQPSGGAMNSPGPAVVCDGSTFQITVQVVSQDLPLRRGAAVVGADIGMNSSTCCSYQGNSAASGPVEVRIR